VLDPDLPIIDTHHHLWHRPDHRYLMDEFLADVRTGHNVVATVFVECHAMYRADGPAEMRPVGETEFVAGVAAMSASGAYGPVRVAAGIVGFADLTLGDRVEAVLEAHVRAGGGRFRGVRHAGGWDASDVIGNSRSITAPHLFRRPDFRAGLRRLTALSLSLDAWLSSALADVIDLRGRSRTPTSSWAWAPRLPLEAGRDEVFASWKASMTGGDMPE
jgi:predicted TIM-barrel fold metal-dependent hydrolase